MCRNRTDEIYSTVLHFHIRVQALGDSPVDNGCLPLLILLNAGLSLVDDFIDLGALDVQVGGDGGLDFVWRYWEIEI